MWLGWREESEAASSILPRLLNAIGEPQRALAASRRRNLVLGSPSFWGIASTMLLEARLSARTGDRDAAIRDYESYLLWRRDPEPVLVPQRDSARAELALLTGR
jgi:hypothetical protein